MSLRYSFISKLVALWFVVLIVLPFTKPFPAFDDGAPFGKPVNSQDLKTSDKLSSDAAVAAAVPAPLPPITTFVIRTEVRNVVAFRHPAVHTVLRL
jgi:hypothetical protein